MGNCWLKEIPGLRPEQVELRSSTLDSRDELFPTDYMLVSQIMFEKKFGQSPKDKILISLERRAPKITELPTARSLVDLIFEASLDFKIAVYKALSQAVAIYNENGDLKEIDEKIAEVSRVEEKLKREREVEQKDKYDTQVRIDAIKAVFGSKS